MTNDRPAGESLRLEAHAKLNLWLRVLGREDSGFHTIESLLQRLRLSDSVTLTPAPGDGIRLEVFGDETVPADRSNLCWRAAEALGREVSDPGVHIRLEKNIPAGAGLGGGSADAAAVLFGLNRLWGRPLDPDGLMRLAGELGSDVPFGLCPSPVALAWERGRRLLPIDPGVSRPVLILVPPYRVSAGEAYGWLAEDRLAGLGGPPGPALLPHPEKLLADAGAPFMGINDLAEPVYRRHPGLRRLHDELLALGATQAMLCGSGSCVAGLFRDESTRDRAAEACASAGEVGVLSTATVGAER